MKKIIVACGSGVATSQTVASKVKRILAQNGVKAEVNAVDIKSLDKYVKASDVYISITKATKDYDIATLSGIPFLTGIGMEEETQKLLDALK